MAGTVSAGLAALGVNGATATGLASALVTGLVVATAVPITAIRAPRAAGVPARPPGLPGNVGLLPAAESVIPLLGESHQMLGTQPNPPCQAHHAVDTPPCQRHFVGTPPVVFAWITEILEIYVVDLGQAGAGHCNVFDREGVQLLLSAVMSAFTLLAVITLNATLTTTLSSSATVTFSGGMVASFTASVARWSVYFLALRAVLVSHRVSGQLFFRCTWLAYSHQSNCHLSPRIVPVLNIVVTVRAFSTLPFPDEHNQ